MARTILMLPDGEPLEQAPSELRVQALEPQVDDTVAVLDLKRRMMATALRLAQQGTLDSMADVLVQMARTAESEKVRAVAARDVLKWAANLVPQGRTSTRTDIRVNVTAADLVAGADKGELARLVEAARSMRREALPVTCRTVRDGATPQEAAWQPVPADGAAGQAQPAGAQAGAPGPAAGRPEGGPGSAGRDLAEGRGTPSASLTGFPESAGVSPAAGAGAVSPAAGGVECPVPPPPAEPPPVLPEFGDGTAGFGRGNPRRGEGANPW